MFRSLIVSVHSAVGTPHDEAFAVIRDRHPGAARSQYGNLLLNLIPRRLCCRASLRVQRKSVSEMFAKVENDAGEFSAKIFWAKTDIGMGPKRPAWGTPPPSPPPMPAPGGIAPSTLKKKSAVGQCPGAQACCCGAYLGAVPDRDQFTSFLARMTVIRLMFRDFATALIDAPAASCARAAAF